MGKKEVVLGGAVLDLWVGLEWAVGGGSVGCVSV